MQPQSRSLNCIPEQSTTVQNRSKTNTGIEEITEEEEEDDYEKMQSYAVKEEAIKAWRMSQQFSKASSYGSFTPPSLQSRKSEHFGSYPSSTPPIPSIRPRSELQSPHSSSSPHYPPQVPTTSSKGCSSPRSNQKRSSTGVVPSTAQTTGSHSPWARSHISNINTNNSSSAHGTQCHGNSTTCTTLASHSNHVVSKSPQRPTTTQGISGSVASNSPRAPHQHTTKATVVEGASIHGGDKDTTASAKRVANPPSPQLPPKNKSSGSPSPMNRSPVPSKKHNSNNYSPTLPKKPSHLSGSNVGVTTGPEQKLAAGANSSKEATGISTGAQQQAEEPEKIKINQVRARLERLEKTTSTLKQAIAQKPRPGMPVHNNNYVYTYVQVATISSNVFILLADLMGL